MRVACANECITSFCRRMCMLNLSFALVLLVCVCSLRSAALAALLALVLLLSVPASADMKQCKGGKCEDPPMQKVCARSSRHDQINSGSSECAYVRSASMWLVAIVVVASLSIVSFSPYFSLRQWCAFHHVSDASSLDACVDTSALLNIAMRRFSRTFHCLSTFPSS